MRESMWKAGCEEGTAAARKARTGRTDAIDSHRREHPYTRMSRVDVGRYLAGDLTNYEVTDADVEKNLSEIEKIIK